jgi:hypothetical protein
MALVCCMWQGLSTYPVHGVLYSERILERVQNEVVEKRS